MDDVEVVMGGVGGGDGDEGVMEMMCSWSWRGCGGGDDESVEEVEMVMRW